MVWKYRLGAFIIDLCVIFLITAIVRNVIPFPVPVWIEYLAPFFSFLFYFLGLSLIKGTDYSFGKDLLSISVKYSGDSEELDLKRLFYRTLIIALIWPLNLQELPGRLFGGDVHEIFGIVLFSLQYAFIIYNIFLVLKTGNMLQDRLTGSVVEFSSSEFNEPHSNPEEENNTLFYKPILLISLILVIAACSFIGNQMSGDLLLFETAKKTKNEEQLETLIYETVGIRNRVNVKENKVWRRVTKDNTTTTTVEMVLNVDVWTPVINWNPDNRASIIDVLNKNLRIAAGRFDRYDLKLWSGYGDLSISYKFTKNLTSK
ncbi:MAG: RDD family protein [Bacteroidota bacterium]